MRATQSPDRKGPYPSYTWTTSYQNGKDEAIQSDLERAPLVEEVEVKHEANHEFTCLDLGAKSPKTFRSEHWTFEE
jgi:hypothetical protein